jgi:predicted LPLAT superfamily acyltransferase
MLADRTLPAATRSARSRRRCRSSAGRRAFADGPFRLAALLRRKVVFMAGLYRGGDRYELRFGELATSRPARRRERDVAIASRALERYVATLEALAAPRRTTGSTSSISGPTMPMPDANPPS